MVRKHRHRHGRERTITAGLPLVMARMSEKYRSEAEARSGARLWLGRLLDWLEGYAGESYQDRWIASDSDNQPKAWCPPCRQDRTRLGHGCPSTHSFCSASFARATTG